MVVCLAKLRTVEHGVTMEDQEYLKGLRELKGIQKAIQQHGAFAALQYRNRLQQLTPVILAEAERRELERLGVANGD